MSGRPVVAVVPFGARASDARAGAWARQIARRLVERFAGEPAALLRPVFLVAVPEAASAGRQDGYLIVGATPDVALAARYGRSLGASHALVGTYREGPDGRALEVTLVDVAAGGAVSTTTIAIPPGELHRIESELASWLAASLGAAVQQFTLGTATGSETAYAALLEAMDEELNATLLRRGDAAGARAALRRALARYLDALRSDARCWPAEERLLVLAAESIERGDESDHIAALEGLVTLDPRSWRAHYLLGDLRRAAGDASGAVVALEHAHALRPLGNDDLVRLAELYLGSDAPAAAASHLRRVKAGSAPYGRAQELLGVLAARKGDLASAAAAFERAIDAGARDGGLHARAAQCHIALGDEAAAARAFQRGAREATPSWELPAAEAAWRHSRGDPRGAVARYRAALRGGAPPATRIALARALAAAGETVAAVAELDVLLAGAVTAADAAGARRLRLGLTEPELERQLESAGRAAVDADPARLSDARAAFERVLAAAPELWEAHFGAGLVARHLGDAAAAERSFRRVLELWPDQPDALHELGLVLLHAARTAEAVPALNGAARLRPDDAGYLADAGLAHLRAGDLVGARARLERARALDAGDPVMRAYLAELERATAGTPD